MTPVFKDEMQFLAWGDGPAGPWIKLLLPDSDMLGPFRGMTAAKKGMAGQRLVGVLVEISDQETPKEPEPEKPKGGELCKLAAILCNDEAFRDWLAATMDEEWDKHATYCESELDTAVAVVREVCGVESRADIDHDPIAAGKFHQFIRKPWAEHNAK